MRDFRTKHSGASWCQIKGITLDDPLSGWKSLEDFNNELINFVEFANRAAQSKPRATLPSSRREAARMLNILKNIPDDKLI